MKTFLSLFRRALAASTAGAQIPAYAPRRASRPAKASKSRAGGRLLLGVDACSHVKGVQERRLRLLGRRLGRGTIRDREHRSDGPC